MPNWIALQQIATLPLKMCMCNMQAEWPTGTLGGTRYQQTTSFTRMAWGNLSRTSKGDNFLAWDVWMMHFNRLPQDAVMLGCLLSSTSFIIYLNLATRGAVLLNVKVSDERRRCGDACVTFLLGLFRRRRIGDVRRRRIGDAESVTQSQWRGDADRRRRVSDAESATQSHWRRVTDAELVTQIQWCRSATCGTIGDAESVTQNLVYEFFKQLSKICVII